MGSAFADKHTLKTSQNMFKALKLQAQELQSMCMKLYHVQNVVQFSCKQT